MAEDRLSTLPKRFLAWVLAEGRERGFTDDAQTAKQCGYPGIRKLEQACGIRATDELEEKGDGPTMSTICRLASGLKLAPGDVANAWAGVKASAQTAPVIPLDPLYNSFVEARRKYGDVAVMVQLQQLEAAAAQLANPKPPPTSGNSGAVASPRRRKTA